MKFNHNADSISESFDIKMSTGEVADKVTAIVKQWMTSEDSSKISSLGEMLHKSLPYEVILFLATQEVYGKVTSTFQDMRDIVDKVIKSIKEEEKRSANLN